MASQGSKAGKRYLVIGYGKGPGSAYLIWRHAVGSMPVPLSVTDPDTLPQSARRALMAAYKEIADPSTALYWGLSFVPSFDGQIEEGKRAYDRPGYQAVIHYEELTEVTVGG